MRIVKITFDPSSLKPTDEAWPAFEAGGMTLKFWALYKSQFLTSQHFREALECVADYFAKAFDKHHPDVKPYTNIDEFLVMLHDCGVRDGLFSQDMRGWALKNWDHFNLSVQRQVALEYEVMEPVKKLMTIEAPPVGRDQ